MDAVSGISRIGTGACCKRSAVFCVRSTRIVMMSRSVACVFGVLLRACGGHGGSSGGWESRALWLR